MANVEVLLRKAVDRSPHVQGLRPHELDDLLAVLLEVAWRVSDTYDPGRGSFSTVLYTAAQRRIIDFLRTARGRTRWQFDDRTYEHELPTVVGLDQLRDAVGAATMTLDVYGHLMSDRITEASTRYDPLANAR